eukprot:6527786-Prymnesium_polylepis.1
MPSPPRGSPASIVRWHVSDPCSIRHEPPKTCSLRVAGGREPRLRIDVHDTLGRCGLGDDPD